MYAQQGLRIALLDARSDIRAHKVLCTHHLQPCGAPILQRLGRTEKLLALGMVETVPTFWTPWGMITPDAAENSPPPGFNVRRETLDPLLRQLANDYPNVDLLLGHRVSGLLTENGTTAGVYGTEQGSAFTVGARLTVGADGKDSTVRTIRSLRLRDCIQRAFQLFRPTLRTRTTRRRNVIVVVHGSRRRLSAPNDGGISVLVVFPALDKLGSFADDLSTAFLEYANALPGAPLVRREHIVGKIVGTKHFSTTLTEPVTGSHSSATLRQPTTRCGVSMLVGTRDRSDAGRCDRAHADGDAGRHTRLTSERERCIDRIPVAPERV